MPPAEPSPELPVVAVLPRVLAALACGANVLLVAPPGAGKTTLVPLALLDAPWRGDAKILVLEPRRLAARAAATRMASLLGEAPGQRVGWRTRLDSAVSAETQIEVITEGLLVRRLQSDPGLEGVAAVLLDEVHERSLDADLAMALCLDLQRGLRRELRLLAMSATADAARLALLLEAEVVESIGRAHPVTVRHAARDLPQVRDLPDAVARAVRTALAELPGDVLAFLPGMAEIRRAETALAGCGAAVLPLHGELRPEQQDAALRPLAGGRRVVLATAIAETSLTVPGVRIVVDGGFRRAPRFDPGSGLARLATLRISRAAAAQRAGRAGREAPGVAIRLWTEATQRGLPEYDRPEILEADLAGLALDCAAWGAEPDALPFPDQPPAGALAQARALLTLLGALGPDGRIAEAGRRMVRLGAHPRLAAMLHGATPDQAALACDLAALLEERDPLRARDAPCDLELRLSAIAGAGHARAEAGADVDRAALARIRAGAAQYRRRLGLRGGAVAAGDPAPLVAIAFPDRIAQSRGGAGSFRLSGGGGARLPDTDRLARETLLAVAALDLHAAPRIRLAAPLVALPPALEQQVTETLETALDPVTGTVLARRRRRLGALVLQDRTEPADPEQAAAALARAVKLEKLDWTHARQLQARVALMRGLDGEAWPDLSDAALEADRLWLAHALHGTRSLAEAERLALVPVLRAGLTWAQLQALDEALPTHLPLPGGRAAVDYTLPVPQAAARAQDFYGLAETPLLAAGRVPLRLALLSPAGRPIAVIGDLAQFWRGGWAEVRREMRGRYPKHLWPEDPSQAAPRSR